METGQTATGSKERKERGTEKKSVSSLNQICITILINYRMQWARFDNGGKKGGEATRKGT